MKIPSEYRALGLSEALKKLSHLQLSFKKRIFDQEQMDNLRGKASVQQIMLSQISNVISLRNKVKRFRDNLLK